MPISSTTGMPVGGSKSSSSGTMKAPITQTSANVGKLHADLVKQRAKIEAMGGKPKKGGPSILGRVFDVLSRGNYAVAEATSRLWEGKSAGSILSGAARGLEGHDKTTFSDAIQRGADAGNKILKPVARNRVAKTALGITGDILLDPLTYAMEPVKLIRAESEAVKAARAGEAAVKATSEAEKVAKAEQAGTHLGRIYQETQKIAEAKKAKVAAKGAKALEEAPKAVQEIAQKGAKPAADLIEHAFPTAPFEQAAKAVEVAKPVESVLPEGIKSRPKMWKSELAKIPERKAIVDTKLAAGEIDAASHAAQHAKLDKMGAELEHLIKPAEAVKAIPTVDPFANYEPSQAFKDWVEKPLSTGKVAGAAREAAQGAGKTVKEIEAGKAAAKAAAENVAHAGTVQKRIAKVSKSLLKEGDKLVSEKAVAAGRSAFEGEMAIPRIPGKVEFRYAGRKLGQSEALYKPLEKFGQSLAGTTVGKAANQTFRNASRYVEGTNRMRRVAESSSMAATKKTVEEEIKPVFKGLNEADRKAVSIALDEGPNVAQHLPEHLQPAYEKAKEIYTAQHARLVEAGVLKPEQKIGDYTHHVYEANPKGLAEKVRQVRRFAVGTESPGFAEARSIKTLQHAETAGLKPVWDAERSLTQYIEKSNSSLARKEFDRQVAEAYGTKATSASAAKALQKSGLREARGVEHLAGHYFPDNVAKSLETIAKAEKDPTEAAKLFKAIESATNEWKFWATGANPGHHIRNMVGDIFNNYLDGTLNPVHYRNAGKLLAGQGLDATFRFGKETLKGSEVLDLYEKTGARTGFFKSEFSQKVNPFKRKVLNMSEKREDFTRLAHFMSAMKDEAKGARSVEEAAHAAASRVRKWNVDYGDLTEAEKKIKKVIPFYTWSRKNIPLQLEAIAMRPGRVAAVPKSFKALSTLLGTENPLASASNPLYPKFMREMMPVRLNGEGSSPWLLAPGLPIQDVSKFAEGGKTGILSSVLAQTAPWARIPIEQATGKTLFSGSQVPVGGAGQYAAQQVPLARILMAAKQGKLKADTAINYLTGAGAYRVDPNEMLSEQYRQQQDTKSQVSKLHKKLLAGG